MIFRSKQKYILQVPRQGGALTIGVVEGKNLEDCQQTAVDALSEEANNPAVRSAKYYYLIDTKSGYRNKFKNPYYNKDEDTETKKKEDKPLSPKEIEEYTYLQALQSMSQSFGKVIPQLTNAIITANIEMIQSLSKEMIQNTVRADTYDNLAKLAQLIHAIVELARNKDQVLALITEMKKHGIGLNAILGVMGGGASESEQSEDKGAT